MADFEACYFCGRAPDGGLGEFAVVPRAFDPAPDEQHGVVLCSTCRDKLIALMKPVIEAAPSDDSEPTASETGSGSRDAEDGGGKPPGGEAGAPGVTSPHGDDHSGDDVTTGSTGDDPGTESVTGAADRPADESGGGAEASARSGPPRDPHRAAHQDVLGDDSETYNRVLRLLRNREFPVQRAEIEEVAATAYELEPSQVSGAIDSMVQKGLLVDQDGTLRRG